MGTGLLMYKSASDLKADELIEEQRVDQERRERLVDSALSSQIKKAFDNAKTAKQPIEQRLLDCARRHKGKYDDDKLRAIQEEGGSTLYPKITATKCRAGEGLLRDIIMPADGRAWGMEPTPQAKLPAELVMRYAQKKARDVAEKAKQIQPLPTDIQGELGQSQMPSPDQPQPQAQQGGLPANISPAQQPMPGLQGMPAQQAPGPQITEEDLENAESELRQIIQEKARKVSDRHEDLIDDQLVEGGYYEAMESFITDLCVYPAAFLRGPLLQKVTEFAWQEGWKLVEVETIKPMFARVSPFDIYPSPDSSDINDGAYLIERERYTRSGLNKLRGVPGYKDEELEAVLEEFGRGGLKEWLASDAERARIEDRAHDWLNNSGETIEGLHYWGSAQGLTLLQWGMSPEQVPDPLAEYEIDAILIGNHVIRCVINLNSMGTRPYQKASYQLVPGSFWGVSVPELMSDIQDMCCAVARAQANNMAFASGPQIEVATDRLQPEEDPNEIFPMKRWRTKSDRSGTGSQQPAIRFYQPQSMAGELMQVYQMWETRADDATGIPRYTYGGAAAGGAGNTASGLSMLLESASKNVKDTIRHIDRGVTRPVIQALWMHNMRYSDDESIKGDCRVVPQGATAQLLRDQTQQARTQFLQATTNDIDMQILGIEGRAKLLRSVSLALDLPDLIPDEDSLKAKEDEAKAQQAQQAQAQQQQMAQQAQMMQQAQEQKLQIEAGKAQADAAQKQANAERMQAETQKILLEVQGLLAQLGAMGIQAPQASQPQMQQQGQPGMEIPQEQYAGM